MIKKWIIGIVVLVMGLGAWHVGRRGYILQKLYSDPDMKHRMAIVPTELDLSAVQVMPGAACKIGYAEFVVPSTQSVDLHTSASGLSVQGTSESIQFAFLVPYDPSAPAKINPFNEELSKLPEGHPLRQALSGPNKTFLDLEICKEQTVPKPFWETIFQDSATFKFNTIQLILKGTCVGLGMRSVHTYHTPETRGLILVGANSGDLGMAHVFIENRSRTQAVSLRILAAGGKSNDVMKVLPAMLKTFRFTVEHLDSKDAVKAVITKAGIPPREEKKASPAAPSTVTE